MDSKDHLLALKVMRLTRPSLVSSIPIYCETQDILGTALSEIAAKDVRTVRGHEKFAVSEVLSLPQTFGNIFLGETFTCYICIHNDSAESAFNIQLQADLQTSAQRLALVGNAPVLELASNESIDQILSHEVKELGTHILICGVHYTTSNGEKLYFRKFFKFQVMKPLDVKTKFHEGDKDDVYLEAQVQNITPNPMFLESVSLDVVTQYHVEDLNTYCDSKGSQELTFGRGSYLSSNDTRQYLFKLTLKNPIVFDPKKPPVSSIGKLDIVWRTSMGEKGRLQTSHLQRMHSRLLDMAVVPEKIIDVAQLAKPFEAILRITNNSSKDMSIRLVMNKKKAAGIVWLGTSGKDEGDLKSKASMVVTCTLLPIKPGLQTLGDLKVTDSASGSTHTFDDICEIFVHTANETPFHFHDISATYTV
ncbi:trafficking protein particle complex subunit 13-like [Oscarella lobularis]|uniref:trafficking protein particle complex subunit 13-like n=1 Tax=Oscarella lobularis TaxID=121494 RepID=UPI0033137465